MRNPLRVFGLSLALWLGFGSPGHSQPLGESSAKDPGVVNGKPAVMVLPVGSDRRGGSPEFLNPEGLEAHLSPYDDPAVDLSYPAGSWFQPPPGRYRIWLQGGWRMTPFSLVMIYSGQGSGGMRSTLPIVGAGRVRLSQDQKAPGGLEFHLLHAGSYLEEGFPRWEISMRKAVSEIGDGVLMPEGKAVGALWDRKNRQYVALSRPFEIRGHETVDVPLEQPGDGALLVAQLNRDALAETAADLEARMVVKQEAEEHPADLQVLTTDKIYAFWYGLRPGPAELKGETRQAFLEPRQLDLRQGKIESVKADLKPRPDLDVQLDLPAPLRHGELALEVRDLPTGKILVHRLLETAAPSYRFERLPPTLLIVELQTGLGSFSRQVDLSSGEDGFLLLKPEVITLTGTVYHGDERTQATLTFANAGRTIETRSRDDGTYEAVFLEPVQTVSIELDSDADDPGASPYFDFFRPALAASKELDFHLPDGDFRVRVLDATTGKGIPKATVDIRNSYLQEWDRDEEDDRRKNSRNKNERAVFQSASTDDTGVARLPPLREGSLEIRASAPGYSAMREGLKAQVLDDSGIQTFEIRLEPAGDTVSLRLQLPDGAPAAGAEVLLLDSLLTGRSLFSARADGDGLVSPPRHQHGFLLVKHTASAFLVREWLPGKETRELRWPLPPASARPLTIRVRGGAEGGTRAELAIWVQGRCLTGAALAWLAGAPVTDPDGYWIARNLPQTSVGVLAWNPRALNPEALDSQAVAIEYPWSDLVEVIIME